MSKRYLGYYIIAVYVLLAFDLYWLKKVGPIIFGMPYALWSATLYGILVMPLLYFVYKWIWPKLPEEF